MHTWAPLIERKQKPGDQTARICISLFSHSYMINAIPLSDQISQLNHRHHHHDAASQPISITYSRYHEPPPPPSDPPTATPLPLPNHSMGSPRPHTHHNLPPMPHLTLLRPPQKQRHRPYNHNPTSPNACSGHRLRGCVSLGEQQQLQQWLR